LRKIKKGGGIKPIAAAKLPDAVVAKQKNVQVVCAVLAVLVVLVVLAVPEARAVQGVLQAHVEV
jgi:hypothetical protein